jgi:hypothetical protein
MHLSIHTAKLPGRGYGVSNNLIYFIMEKFVKLSRAEMKEILGGENAPPCTNECETDQDCISGETCKSGISEACPSKKICTS